MLGKAAHSNALSGFIDARKFSITQDEESAV
jgi:hypothetical protein